MGIETFNREIKNLVRKALLRLKRRVSKCALLMPSYEMLDIKALIGKKEFNRHTFVFAIEENKYIADALEHQLGKYFDHYFVYRGRLENFDFRMIKEKAGRKLDFVYLDTCGNLRQDLYQLIYDLPKFCTANAFLAFTFSAVARKNVDFFGSNWSKLFGSKLISEDKKDWPSEELVDFEGKNEDRYCRIHDLDTYYLGAKILGFSDAKPAIFDKSVLIAAILEELTGGEATQRHLYLDNGRTYWMTTCAIQLGGKGNAAFLKWSKHAMAGIKAGKTRKRNA
jgi:hypothetical protein